MTTNKMKTSLCASRLMYDDIEYGMVVRRYLDHESGKWLASTHKAGAVVRQWAKNRNAKAVLTNTQEGFDFFEDAHYEDRFYAFQR